MSAADIPLVSGPNPGVLDPFQPSRLLRTPTSRLFFASFDPHAARSVIPSNAEQGEKSIPNPTGKRIVIEADMGSFTSTWRFVPRATNEMGSEDEGVWPRIVELCGRTVYMTQDQWDIHKLDPEYECIVHAYPSLTTITRKVHEQPAQQPQTPRMPRTSNPPNCESVQMEDATRGAPPTPITPTPQAGPSSQPAQTTTPKVSPKRKREATPIARTPSPGAAPSIPIVVSDDEDVVMDDTEDSDLYSSDNYAPPLRTQPQFRPQAKQPTPKAPHGVKRSRFSDRMNGKAPEAGPSNARPSTSRTSSGDGYEPDPSPDKKKKTRVPEPPGPSHIKNPREEAAKLRRRKKALEEHLFARRQARERAIWEDLGVPSYVHDTYANVHANPNIPSAQHYYQQQQKEQEQEQAREWEREQPPPEHEEAVPSPEQPEQPEQPPQNPPPSSSDPADGEESEEARLTRLAESRRKLEELERDKPLWEAAKRRREAKEREEEVRRREARVRREFEEKLLKEAQEARQRENMQREQERRARQEEALKQERRNRMFVQSPLSPYRPWRPEDALRRYNRTSETFDEASFSARKPLTFAAIPWPMLSRVYSCQDVEWEAIDKFYREVKMIIPLKDYKQLLKQAKMRFHPDRWRSRKILVTIEDELERNLIEVAGMLTSQAVSGLWDDIKDLPC